MRLVLLQMAISVFCISSCYAQTTDEVFLKFIPKGYHIFKTEQGLLNSDNLKDVILVLAKDGEDTISTIEKPVKRKTLILLGEPNNSYKLIFQNENVVCYYGYDPNFIDAFVDIRIEKEKFTIDHYGGFATRWGRSTTFTYDAKLNNWFLTEDEYSTFSATEPNDKGTEELLNKKDYNKLPFSKFDIYKQ